MANKALPASEPIKDVAPATDADVQPKRRYTPTVDNEAASTQALPRWLRFPPLSPLRKLRRTRWWPYLALIGPGIIAGSAGNDAGGIATYASTGASYGYTLLWAMLVVTVSFALVQEMCARMGAVTGKGLMDLIREQFGVGWSMLAVLVILIANTGVTISEFVAIAAVAELLGLPGWLVVPPAAFLIWWLITQGSYKRVEKVFVAFALVFLSYVAAAFLAKPDWGQVGAAFFHPTISLEPTYLAALVALIGTTITPYIQLYEQSSVVEKGVTPRDYKYTRFDAIFGVIFSDLISVFIIVATAATLYAHGTRHISSAAEAAKALEPVAGPSATILFAVGLFGASMLAAGVLPLATAYSVTESLGFEKGVSLSFREAPVFMGLFTVLVILGALVAMIPGLPLFTVLILVQILNGILLPIILVFIVRLASNKEIMGRYAIGPVYKVFAWGTVVVITTAVALMLITTFLQ
jgi:Mn2+/Fe2+ NRAMP family transporter